MSPPISPARRKNETNAFTYSVSVDLRSPKNGTSSFICWKNTYSTSVYLLCLRPFGLTKWGGCTSWTAIVRPTTPAFSPTCRPSVSARGPAVERRGDNSNGFQNFCTEDGSSQGHHLALTSLFGPSFLDSGTPSTVDLTENITLERKGGHATGVPRSHQPRPLKTLQLDYAQGPMEVLGGGRSLMSEVPLQATNRCFRNLPIYKTPYTSHILKLIPRFRDWESRQN